MHGRIRLLVRFGGVMAVVIGVTCLYVGFTTSSRYLTPFTNLRDAFISAGLVLPPIGVVLLVLSYAVPGGQDNRRGGAAPRGVDRSNTSSQVGALRRGRKFVIAGWLICGVAVLYVLFVGWMNPDPQHGFLLPDVLLAILAFLVACAMIVSGTVLLAYGLLTQDSARTSSDSALLIGTLGAATLLLVRWLF